MQMSLENQELIQSTASSASLPGASFLALLAPHEQLLLPAEILMCPCLGVRHSCRVNKGVALGRGEESHRVLLCSVCFRQPDCLCPCVSVLFVVLGRQQRVRMSVACVFLFINDNLFHYY